MRLEVHEVVRGERAQRVPGVPARGAQGPRDGRLGDPVAGCEPSRTDPFHEQREGLVGDDVRRRPRDEDPGAALPAGRATGRRPGVAPLEPAGARPGPLHQQVLQGDQPGPGVAWRPPDQRDEQRLPRGGVRDDHLVHLTRPAAGRAGAGGRRRAPDAQRPAGQDEQALSGGQSPACARHQVQVGVDVGLGAPVQQVGREQRLQGTADRGPHRLVHRRQVVVGRGARRDREQQDAVPRADGARHDPQVRGREQARGGRVVRRVRTLPGAGDAGLAHPDRGGHRARGPDRSRQQQRRGEDPPGGVVPCRAAPFDRLGRAAVGDHPATVPRSAGK